MHEPAVAPLERIDAQIHEIQQKIATERSLITLHRRKRKALTEERYALVKAREILSESS